ncbi:MAG: DUF4338 domain-containing protein, partial [Desulfovibrio sp.]|nr:DUF4338 domain-containing protein [Desulfovibrio sp.]
MEKQSQIKKTLSLSENQAKVRNCVEAKAGSSRQEIADAVCELFGFRDQRGQLQRNCCTLALDGLRQKQQLNFPEPAPHKIYEKRQKPKMLQKEVPEPIGVPERIEEMEGVNLVLADNQEKKLILNTLLEYEQPLGATKFAGAQVKYLIESPYGILGCAVFAASALNLEERDIWIGWTREEKDQYLHYIIGMNRFLIRPMVRCTNLASYMLGKLVKQAPNDFEMNYGYRPLLIETFVDTYQDGSCYKASNWEEIGLTKGKGRSYQHGDKKVSRKKIFIYVLDKDFRNKF